MQHKRLMVVGGLPNVKRRLGFGGATVLMQNFVDFLNQVGANYSFIQTNRYFDAKGNPCALKNKIVFLIEFLIKLPWCEIVMFNFSDHATVGMFPKLIKVARLLGKKTVFRKFGGSLDLYLEKYPETVRKRTFESIAKADLILLETKKSIEHVSGNIGRIANIEWFPNVRKATALRSKEEYQKRFVFISHILDEKGVGDILDVSRELPDGYIIDLYGPIKEAKYESFQWERYNVSYGGVLTSDEVLHKLIQYNLLLLTSYREGYPGIIIEAMSVGVPCISTTVGGIPEIVGNGHNGVLVEAGNREQIRSAILSITQESYSQLRKNSLRVFQDNFESERTNERILHKIYSLC